MKHKSEVLAVFETKFKENMVHSNIELDGYQFIHRNSLTLARGVGIYVKNSISFNMKPNIYIELPLVENSLFRSRAGMITGKRSLRVRSRDGIYTSNNRNGGHASKCLRTSCSSKNVYI